MVNHNPFRVEAGEKKIRLINYIAILKNHNKSAISSLGQKLDALFLCFDLNRTSGVNPKNELSALIDAQKLVSESSAILRGSGVAANKLNGYFLEEYALNLLKFLVWNDLGLNLLVLALGVDIPLWSGYIWDRGIPIKNTARWRPDVAIGRYFEDTECTILNSTNRELVERRTWNGIFVPLTVVSCKTRVSTAEFYDTRARFEIIRRTSPYTLSVELANRNAIAKEHLKADAMGRNAYFLEQGQSGVNRFVDDVKKHLKEFA